jgi:hypothetical protein
MDKITAYNNFNNTLLEFEGVVKPRYRPGIANIKINVEEYKLYRNGNIFTLDPPKKGGNIKNESKCYIYDIYSIL